MEEKIKALYESINFIGFQSMYSRDTNYMEKIRGLLPDVQEFAEWFLQGDAFGFGEELYQSLRANLLDILKDCADALQEDDRVLMMDALEQGIAEYLRMFLPEDYLREKESLDGEAVAG